MSKRIKPAPEIKEIKKGKQGNKPIITIDKIKKFAPMCHGNVSNIAKNIGVVPASLYQFLSDYPELKTWIRSFKESFHDEVEDIMEQMIRDRCIPIIIFYAKTQMRNRGYNERIELTDGDGNPLQQPMTINYILPPLPKDKKEYDPLKEVMPPVDSIAKAVQKFKETEEETDASSEEN